MVTYVKPQPPHQSLYKDMQVEMELIDVKEAKLPEIPLKVPPHEEIYNKNGIEIWLFPKGEHTLNFDLKSIPKRVTLFFPQWVAIHIRDYVYLLAFKDEVTKENFMTEPTFIFPLPHMQFSGTVCESISRRYDTKFDRLIDAFFSSTFHYHRWEQAGSHKLKLSVTDTIKKWMETKDMFSVEPHQNNTIKEIFRI